MSTALASGPILDTVAGSGGRADLDAAADGDAQLALYLAAQPRHHARREGVVEAEGVADRQALLTHPQAVAAAQTHWLKRFLQTRVENLPIHALKLMGEYEVPVCDIMVVMLGVH